MAAKPHLSFEEYGKQLRQLAAVARSKVLRLCLLALADHETEQRTRTEADAKQRAEIDAILAECAREQAVKVGGPKTIPEAAEPVSMGPPPAAPSVPVDGVSSEAVSPPELEQPAVRIPDSPNGSETKRAELLAQGRALAANVLVQYERFTRCPQNLQESQILDKLQAAFLAWERQAHLQLPSIDTLKEFSDVRLRPPPPKMLDGRTYLLHRRVLTLDQLLNVPSPAKPEKDNGIWAGTGPGI
jgi:hypothetical protein